MDSMKKVRKAIVWMTLILLVMSFGAFVVSAVCTDSDSDGAYAEPGCYPFDCDDANNSLLPPYEGLVINRNITFCPGDHRWNVSQGQMMNITANNVQIHGNGARISCNQTGGAVLYIRSADDLLMEDFTIENCSTGINFFYLNLPPEYWSDRSVVRNISFINKTFGLYVQHSSALVVSNLTFIDSDLFLRGDVYPGPQNTNLSDITFDGSSLILQGGWARFNRLEDMDFVNQAGYANIEVWGAAYNIFENMTMEGEAIDFLAGYGNNFTNITAEGYNTGNGVHTDGSIYNNTFTNLTLTKFNYGIHLYSTSNTQNNTFTRSRISNCTNGIIFSTDARKNILYSNKIYDTQTYHVWNSQNSVANINNLSILINGVNRGNYWDDIASLDITDSDENGLGDSGSDYPYSDQTSAKVYANPSFYHVYDFGPRVHPIVHDNSTPGDRYWFVDMPASIRLYTQTWYWQDMSWCNHTIYQSPCLLFNKTADNDTTVIIPGISNNVSQSVLRYYHNDSDGLNSSITDSGQVNVVYGSYIENSSLWNTSVHNSSYIVHSDVNDTLVDHCNIRYSIVVDVTNVTGNGVGCDINNTQIYHSTLYRGELGNSTIYNTSITEDSTIEESQVNDSRILGCGIYGSTIRNAIAYEHSNGKCAIRNSVILDSTVTNSVIEDSYIDPTTVIDSTIINSTCNDCNISYSTIVNSDICGPFNIIGATIVDKILTAGKIEYLGTEYFSTVSTDAICTELPRMNISYPSAGSVVNGTVSVAFRSTENRSIEISIDGGAWTATGSNSTYSWDTTLLQDGGHTLQVRDRDAAGQYVQSVVMSYIVDNTPDGIAVLRPTANSVVYDDYSVEVIAADYVSQVRFSAVNASGAYALDGSPGYTADGPAGGFTGLWQTANFAEGTYTLNVSAHTRCFFLFNCYNATITVENISIDRTAPTGSIEIIGTHGSTSNSPYSSVVLNVTFADNFGVEACRYANEAEAELAGAVWEPCMTMKPWLLSAGEGTRTVWYSIKDLSGNMVNYSDSITMQYTPDTTPPTDPTVEDGLTMGEDIDWMKNTTIKANWYGSLEDLSQVYYKYRVLENGSCIGGCTYTDAGQNTSAEITGIDLVEGTNYSVSVIAYNSFSLESNNISSDGAVTDFTGPGNVEVTSPTHPVEGQGYANTTAIFYFNATDPVSAGVASGVYGYSWELDDWPGTKPDNRLDGRLYERVLAMPTVDGGSVLKLEDTGHAYVVQSQVKRNVYTGQRLRLRFAVYETEEDTDQDMRIDVGVVDDACANFASCSFVGLNYTMTDVRYAYTPGLARVYELMVTVGSDVTDGDFFVVVAGNTSDDDNANNLSIAYGDALDTGTTTYYCEETIGSCVENASRDYAMTADLIDESNQTYVVTYELLGDDNYYFHVRAQDLAGNFGNVTHYNFIVDTGAASLEILEPIDNEFFIGNGEENISVKVYSTENVSGWVEVVHPDTSRVNSSPAEVDGEWIFENITLQVGENTLYFYGNSSNGVVARSLPVDVQLGQAGSASNKTVRVSYTACGNAQSNLCYNDEGGIIIGLGSEAGAPGANSYLASTDINAVKVFATVPFDYTGVNSELDTDVFQDSVNPMFGLKRRAGEYVLRDELRYQDIYLGGDFKIGPGRYSLYLRQNSRNADGTYNVSLVIR